MRAYLMQKYFKSIKKSDFVNRFIKYEFGKNKQTSMYMDLYYNRGGMMDP